MRFEVWAPNAKSVALVLGDARVPMASGERGWWTAEAQTTAGARYRFALDDSEPLADPRSAFQPEGVFGPSAVVDHSAFAWTDGDWHPPPFASAVIYELHIGTFTPHGTFDSAIERLDHLVNLGVTHVQVMPVNQFSGEHGWGYDGVFLYAPQHSYGGPDGLKRFVNACHARGLAVLMDVVYNHFGPEGSVADPFGPYTTDLYTNAWGRGVNLDGPGSDTVKRFFCDNAIMWMRDYHCDGLRLDAVHGLRDISAKHFLEQLSEETDALSAQLGRALVLVPETNLNDPKFVRSRDANGYGLTAQWNDDFHHAVHVTLAGERDGYYADFLPWIHLQRALREGYVYQGEYSPFLQHSLGRPALLSGQRLVGFLQNHDQIGNHAHGRRLSAHVALERCKVGIALLMTAPFIPMLFQGEEWGTSAPFPYFCDHKDPKLIEAVREGRKREFGAFGGHPDPDPEAPDTFAGAHLCWDEMRKPEHADLLEWYRRLVAIRRTEPDLSTGRLDQCQVQIDERGQWLSLKRGRVQLCFNLNVKPQSIPVASRPDARRILAQSGTVTLAAETVTLGADGVVILAEP